MRGTRMGVAALIVAVGSSSAFGWGHSGHEVVGAIADKLLKANASAKVQSVLGHPLSVAATWPDCARDVHKNPDGTFTFVHNAKYDAPCPPFETATEQPRMEDYAKRNWDNCSPVPKGGCHTDYHFADVATQHDHYDRSFIGTSDHDIVSAMVGAIAVLRGQQAAAPLSIKDEKEALYLLAHFAGDIHQPLHVGAVYLAPTGSRVDPDAAGQLDPATKTNGGNFIHDGKMNLHSEWDTISSILKPTAINAKMLADAKAVPVTSGDPATWPAVWATETVVESHTAFKNVSFAADPASGQWKVIFANPTTYNRTKRRVQAKQLAKGGARLAQLLNAIWP